MLSGSSWTTLQSFLPVQCYPKSIKTTLKRIFSCALFSGASCCTLHKVFTCGMLSQKYCLRQHLTGFFLCNIVWSLLDNIGQDFFLSNVVPGLTDNFHEEYNLWNDLLTMLEQQCIGLLSSQCCLNTPKTTLHKKITHAMLVQGRKNMFLQENKQPIQCCLDLPELTLHKKITFAMLGHCPQTTLHRKIFYNFVRINLGQLWIRKLLVQCWPRAHRYTFTGRPTFSNMSGVACF